MYKLFLIELVCLTAICLLYKEKKPQDNEKNNP